MAGTIVVGVDGSEHAQAALRWAAEEAALRDARLLAIAVWTYVPPPQPIDQPGMMAGPGADLPGVLIAEKEAVEERLAGAVTDTLGDDPACELELRAVEGAPAEVLVIEAAGAELLVVGTRGRGSLKSALLGSVSKHVLQHAPCPVVVLRAGVR